MNKNIQTFIGCDAEYEDAGIVLFGAPYDCTTSFRPGTRFASKAMRGDSFGIETYSPYQDKDLTDIKVFDGGDLELCLGNTNISLNQIEELVTHNIFYTAITRAREKLKIYWTPEVEEKVINRIKPRDISKDVELLKNYLIDKQQDDSLDFLL